MKFWKIQYLLVPILIGCVSYGQMSTLPIVADADNAATITVIRIRQFLAGGVGIKVFFDSQNIANLKKGSHIKFKVEHGSHSIDIKMREDLLASTDVICKAREQYFIKFSFTNWGPKVEAISQKEAQELISKTEYLPLE